MKARGKSTNYENLQPVFGRQASDLELETNAGPVPGLPTNKPL